MKCVCGYEHEEEWVKDSLTYKVVKGDKKFLQVEGHFTITKSYDYNADEVKKVSLHACPECGTIKMNPDWY